MTDSYKLCPKCNNALDNNVMQCPYCGESLGINFGGNNIKKEGKAVETKGCSGTAKILFIIFFVIPLISSAVSFIMGLISGIFE